MRPSVSESPANHPAAEPPVPAVREQEAGLLAAIVNASDDAILSKTLDGIVTTWNPAAERMFGYTALEIIGQPNTILFPPDRLQEETVILDRLRRGIPTDHFETVRVHKNGTRIDVSITISPIRDRAGNLIGASTIVRDITERKRAEMQVKLLSTAAVESVNGIVITDRQQRILFVNPAYERLTGYTLEELRGPRPGEVVQGPDTDRATRMRVREAIERGQPVGAGLLNYRKDGTPYWIQLHIIPVRNEQGETTHFIANEIDTTHLRQTETSLLQSHEKMNALIEAIPDIILRVDREGVILDNFGGKKNFALVTTNEALGKRLCDFTPAPVGALVQRGIEAALVTHTMQTLQYQISIEGSTRTSDYAACLQRLALALLNAATVAQVAEAVASIGLSALNAATGVTGKLTESGGGLMTRAR